MELDGQVRQAPDPGEDDADVKEFDVYAAATQKRNEYRREAFAEAFLRYLPDAKGENSFIRAIPPIKVP